MGALTRGVAQGGQPLETETARFLPRNGFLLDSTFEYQASAEGIEMDVPMAFEYGALDWLGVLVEPVWFTSIQPKHGLTHNGFGDVETTLEALVVDETDWLPALAIAGEIKIPTATDKFIGTGRADYTPFVIASKRLGDFDLHANIGYSFVGQPPGPALHDLLNYAAAVEYQLTPEWEVVGEITGNTSALSSAEGKDTGTGEGGSVTPEAAGNEVVGTVGARFHLSRLTSFALGMSYDNNNAFLIRPGLSFEF